jgi:hypothetical protein
MFDSETDSREFQTVGPKGRVIKKRKTQSPHSKLPEQDIYRIPYKKQYFCQQPGITWYSIKQKDVEKLKINQVGDAIKTKNEELKSSIIIDRHLAYDNLNVSINKDLNTISDLIENSNGDPMISFTFNMEEWMKQYEKDKNQQQKINKQLQEDNKQLQEDNKYLKKHCLHKILIRQVRKEMKEEILDEISKKFPQIAIASFKDKCELVSDDLRKPKSMFLPCLPRWTKEELVLLFNNPTYNEELNVVAHPKFREDKNSLNELEIACYPNGETYNEKLNYKCYIELYGNYGGSKKTDLPTTSSRTGN